MHPRTWPASVTAQLEEVMRRIARPGPSLAIALVVSACAGGSQPSTVESPSAEAARSLPASAAPGPTPSAVATAEAASPTPAPPTPAASPTTVTSDTYGYSITIPGDWTTIQATAAWDGTGAPFHDVPEADQFVSPGTSSAWLFAAPTTKGLAARVQESLDANAAAHSATCPPVPESQDPVQVGAEPGVLLAFNCGIMINTAIAIHDGVAYVFGFRDPAVHAATSPEDRRTFLDLLESVKFPD